MAENCEKRTGPQSRSGALTGRDRVGQSQCLLGALDMQILDEFAFDHQYAFTLADRLGMRRDDLFRPRNFGVGRAKCRIGPSDGLGVKQGLAVEAQLSPLLAGIEEALVVVELEID